MTKKRIFANACNKNCKQIFLNININLLTIRYAYKTFANVFNTVANAFNIANQICSKRREQA